MNYRPRHAEGLVRRLAGHFRVVLVTGARQTGKSTLLKHLFPRARHVLFDPLKDMHGARRDPDLFLDTFPPPLVLDEIQFVPELLPALKRRVEGTQRKGLYLMTGSQNLALLRDVSESLAGRVGIVHLEGMTPLELAARGRERTWLPRWLKEPEKGPALFGRPAVKSDRLVRFLWRGTLPALLDLPDDMVPHYWDSYVRTYVERDVRVAGDVRNLADFTRFLELSAALTAQEINDSQCGREVGLAPATARHWRELLSASYQWTELSPYHGNTLKRVSGKRKGHIADSGLACHLLRLSSPEALLGSPLLGPLFESWVVHCLRQQFVCLRMAPQLCHWRSAGGAEVDVVLELDGRLYPIEVKCGTSLSGHDARGLRAFRDTYGKKVAPGLILYAGQDVVRLDRDTTAIPWNSA